MLPKPEGIQATNHRHRTSKAPMRHAPPTPSEATPIGKLSAARAAVRQFLAAELDAREIRIVKIAPLGHDSDGWRVEAEVLVPDLQVKMLGLPLTQEVLERERYSIELDHDLSVRSYGSSEPDEE